jgi:hypothetical protein
MAEDTVRRDPGAAPDEPGAGAAPPANEDERRELTELRAEVARLRAALAAGTAEGTAGGTERGPGAPSRPRRAAGAWTHRGRAVTAALLVVVGVVLAPLSVVSVWARGIVTDTDRYVETIAPLADDPALQEAVANRLTDRVFEYVDVQGLTTQAFASLAERGSLPPLLAQQLTALAGPLAEGARRFAEDQVLAMVRSDAFERAWLEANRVAHQQLVAALTGQEGSTLRIRGDTVTVDLGAFLADVKERLVSRGFGLAERIPAVGAEVVLFRSDDVSRVQRQFRLLDALGFWLPLVCVVLVGTGVLLSRNRRAAFLAAGLGLAVAMTVTGLGLAVSREVYLSGVPADLLPPDAASRLYDTLVRFLRDAMRAGFLLGVLVAGLAFLGGPSRPATALRGRGYAVLGAAKGGLARAGLDLEPVTRRVAPHARVLDGTVFVVAVLALLAQPYRTPGLVGRVAVLVVVALVLVRFLAVPPRDAGGRGAPEHAPAGATATTATTDPVGTTA